MICILIVRHDEFTNSFCRIYGNSKFGLIMSMGTYRMTPWLSFTRLFLPLLSNSNVMIKLHWIRILGCSASDRSILPNMSKYATGPSTVFSCHYYDISKPCPRS